MAESDNMKRIGIWVDHDVVMSSVTGVMDFFTYCNKYWQLIQQSDQLLFETVLMGPHPQLQQGPFTLQVEAVDFNQIDILLIPGFYAYNSKDLQRVSQELLPYKTELQQMLQQGKWLGAFCNGTFALAGTGLLNGLQATSVWFFKDYFRQMFPLVKLDLQQLVVQQQTILTGGATTSYLNLCLRFVEMCMDTAFAQQMAKIMLTDPNRTSQLPYLSLQLAPQHKDAKLAEIQQYLQAHLAEPVSLEQLAETFAMTPRTLIRRFKQHLDETPMAYLQRLRIERAKSLLENTLWTAEDIMQQVGYEDISSFRKLFVHYTSLTPKAYRQKFMFEPQINCCPVSGRERESAA
ncbi:helix-turn-helix domain-containing protein [Rheinheimera sp. KL1]|uniref:GlxA family transcriptional regulator n=1 Tax=Rheinheimera sp. KL1 TaxID=1635005 RepID=UPI0006A9E543|nr:helix-turn-helix domain-containing protein [Rheinheimera sp. KL1]